MDPLNHPPDRQTYAPDPATWEQLLQERQMALLITDLNQVVRHAQGNPQILAALHIPTQATAAPGGRLADLFPELAHYPAQMADLEVGELAFLTLPRLKRQSAGGHIHCLDVTIHYRHHPAQEPAGLLCLISLAHPPLAGQQWSDEADACNEISQLQEKVERQAHALAIANAEIEHAAKTKSRFISVAAHELRTPLAAVTGYVDLLLDGMFGPLNQEQTEFLHIILESARRLLQITNNLLDATMLESGHLELLLHPQELIPILQRIAREVQPKIEESQQILTLELDPGLGPAMIDESRMVQILVNLISNASKYTQPGGQITIRLEAADEPGFARIAVQDTGVGISLEEQGRLFSRFFRASTAHLVNASGTGLGLHITKHLVELHGGRIWLESTPGQGSTFYVILPLGEGE